MTTRSNKELQIMLPLLSADHIKQAIVKLNNRIADLEKLQIESGSRILTEAELKSTVQQINATLVTTYTEQSREYKESKFDRLFNKPAAAQPGFSSYFGRSSSAEQDAERLEQQKTGVSAAITKLRGHIKILSERLIELDPDGSAQLIQHTHELTSLPSLKQFDIDIEEMARSDDHPFTIAFVDIDNFKSINSRIGHGKADDVIKHLAQLLVEATFERAKVYHRSGDEFLMILENTTSKEAQLFLARVIAEVKAEPFPHLGKTLSISIGAASCPEHSKDVTLLKEQSNKAMQKAKEKKGSVAVFQSKA